MTDRARILILSLTPLISEPRVLKQISLFRDRYDVVTCGMGPAPEGVTCHYELPVESRNWVDDRMALLTRRYERAYWNIAAVRMAKQLLNGGDFDVVIAHDVNTLPLALSLKPRRGVHADMHEFAPRVKENSLAWRLAVAPFIRWICRKYLPRMASTTAVAPGIAERYERDFGVRVGVVINAAPYADLQPQPGGEQIKLVHSGAAFRSRELETYVAAMRGAPRNMELHFFLMPNEPEYLDELKSLAEDVPAVHFHNPVPYSDLVGTMARFDVSIAFFPPTTFNLVHALPNKFFEAVQARLGVIIGPSIEMKRFVDEHSFGTVTADFTVGALKRTITSLDRESVQRWKAASHKAAAAMSAERQLLGWSEPIDALLKQ